MINRMVDWTMMGTKHQRQFGANFGIETMPSLAILVFAEEDRHASAYNFSFKRDPSQPGMSDHSENPRGAPSPQHPQHGIMRDSLLSARRRWRDDGRVFENTGKHNGFKVDFKRRCLGKGESSG